MGDYQGTSELLRLRAESAEARKLIAELRTIGATTMIQANELKAWLIALLKKVGPQEIALADLEAIGTEVDAEGTERPTRKGTVFLVQPIEDKPGIVLLTVGDLEREERRVVPA